MPSRPAEVHQQLKGKSVTLQLLWEEYREREPLGYRSRKARSSW
ncbi:MAG TPA: hypothetical protein VN970_07930 [Thermoanaerobaculia bacterium]|nr:hypothetical protein [Thermoanaerobaculia bacterium]